MHLTGEWFQSLLKDINPRADDRRRVPRVGVRFTVQMTPLADGRPLPPVQVWVRDISSLGIGITYSSPMNRGQRFVLHLPQVQDRPLLILCEVRSCRALTRELSAIGAEFLQIGGRRPQVPQVPVAATPIATPPAPVTAPAAPTPDGTTKVATEAVAAAPRELAEART